MHIVKTRDNLLQGKSDEAIHVCRVLLSFHKVVDFSFMDLKTKCGFLRSNRKRL